MTPLEERAALLREAAPSLVDRAIDAGETADPWPSFPVAAGSEVESLELVEPSEGQERSKEQK